MSNKSFVRQRICIYAGQDVDPDNDEQVGNILRFKLGIKYLKELLWMIPCPHLLVIMRSLP